jgi:drug/metabolite transporter (DMT)-like permease
MLTAHHINAFLLIGVCVAASAAAFWARRSRAGSAVSDHHRAKDHLHYAYGTFALLAVLSPWLYAPTEPRARLLWFAVATLVAAALGVRAFMTA